jgi:muconate cycloisomerase
VKDACGPDFQIILDPNQRFEDVPTAFRMAQGLAEVGNVRCLEDPIARWDIESLAHLRQRIGIPIALHVSLPYNEMGYQHITDILRAVKLDACDYFNFNGGLYNVSKMATIAELTRKPFWHGSEVDLGILEASYLHKCASSKEALLPSDIFGRVIREHDLLKEAIPFENGYAQVPTGNGLGVELDAAALEHYGQETWSTEG